MNAIQLNELHAEYQHRFKVEFEYLLQQSTFLDAIFGNFAKLFADQDSPITKSLSNSFGNSIEGIDLGLCRTWDEKQSDPDLLSIPNLVMLFENYNFLGCHTLKPGAPDRELFDALYKDPLRFRLRTWRTEAAAHSIKIGVSRDRRSSDLTSDEDFNLINGEVANFGNQTIKLLFSLNAQLNVSPWFDDKSLDEIAKNFRHNHVSLLQRLTKETLS